MSDVDPPISSTTLAPQAAADLDAALARELEPLYAQQSAAAREDAEPPSTVGAPVYVFLGLCGGLAMGWWL